MFIHLLYKDLVPAVFYLLKLQPPNYLQQFQNHELLGRQGLGSMGLEGLEG
nr:hypothetical protein Iba_chr10bCG5890 [Ipomoea batatas]GMD51220.1 hypothetical protein Iba_chr11bCG0210 [Ipomoea batatas]GME16750.1 hypothetical protein Iba_scaffold17844CG0640 [Ipomoea batatas]